MFETLGATMKLQRLLSLTRKAIDDYQLIEENDKIAIGISGGKDSLTLLCALAHLQKFYPIPFSICAITVDLGYPDFDTSNLSTFCNTLNVEYHVVKTDIADIIGFQNKTHLPISKNPCPIDGHTKRTMIRKLLKQLNQQIPGCKERMFHAILNGKFDDWPIPIAHPKHNMEQ